MKSTFRYIGLLLCGVVICSWAYAQSPTGEYRIRKIVIDAGHGGKDPGVVGKRLKEKNVVLAIALQLGKLLKEQHPEVEIVYTRDKDVFIPLDERSAIANRCNADLFISIHANGVRNKRNVSARGSETYIMGLHRSADNMEVAQRENSVISYERDYETKYEGFDPHSPESYIIFSLMQNTYFDQSLAFAGMVQEQLPLSPIKKSRGVQQAGFVVLWQTTMPSVLIEIGFLSNPAEEALLASAETRNDIAKRIATAFSIYKARYEQHGTAADPSPATPPPATPASSVTPAPPPEETPATTTPQKTPIYYSIQIFATGTPRNVNDSEYASLKDMRGIYDGLFYKYIVEKHKTYDAAFSSCLKLRRQYPDAFVVRVQGDKILPRK
ncbi:MAG: N-acetylmuramoyl-L-alanine amidase [Prevotellaceae bacterium]|jgi:N-acetylmuramoyl-L-alanine amidase|nr:N-acetylmuramoyl-L-alanine amidase [Prevotellaceae bacterium]